MSDTKMNNEEMNFETMMEQRLQANFTEANKAGVEVSNERLKEMNKKLPSWSLEPPYSFLR